QESKKDVSERSGIAVVGELCHDDVSMIQEFDTEIDGMEKWPL
uniref:Uncharacterized protein n=1 Tax=Meloidogyne javanica TaxID=6303 RepID=A0A915MIM7_MELJA